MPWKKGEVYRCPDPNCGCEVAVTKEPRLGMGGDRAPTCCCGKTMTK
jgi:hypothetical protein